MDAYIFRFKVDGLRKIESGSLAIVLYLLLAFVKALHNRGSPWYLRGLIREPLRKIGVVLLHDVEHRFLGESAMVLGK